jgi:ABC-type bacteriocin/lantibiotic exporter with double-glycine peptidase domain
MVLDLPDVRQQKEWSCGRAILEALHIHYERNLNPTLSSLCNPIQGLAPETLDASLRAAGFLVHSGSFNVQQLKSHTRIGYPVACLVQFEQTGHWVLVSGVERGKVHFNCPIRGKVSQPVSEWNKNWRDIHWLGCEYRNWGTCAVLD